MFMACLYDEWYDEEKQSTLRSFSILTTEPCTKLAWLHDRMPVILVGTDQARAPTHPHTRMAESTCSALPPSLPHAPSARSILIPLSIHL